MNPSSRSSSSDIPSMESMKSAIKAWNTKNPDKMVPDWEMREKTGDAWKKIFLVKGDAPGEFKFEKLNALQRVARKHYGNILSWDKKPEIAEIFKRAMKELNPPPMPSRNTLLGPAVSAAKSGDFLGSIPTSTPSVGAAVKQAVPAPVAKSSAVAQASEAIKGIDLYENDLRASIGESLGVSNEKGETVLKIRTFEDIAKLAEYTGTISFLEQQLQEFGCTESQGKVIFKDIQGVPLTSQQKKLLSDIKKDLDFLKKELSDLVRVDKGLITDLYNVENFKYLSDPSRDRGQYNKLRDSNTCLTESFGFKLDPLPAPSKVGVNPLSPKRMGGPPPALPNIGNSCYMNSPVQALLVTMKHLEPILTAPLKQKPGEPGEAFSRRQGVHTALNNVIAMANLNKSEKEMQVPMTILRQKISLLNSDMLENIYAQHDAREVLNAILEALDVSIPMREVSYREDNIEGLPPIRSDPRDDRAQRENTHILELSIPRGAEKLELQKLLKQELSPVHLEGRKQDQNNRKIREIDGVPKVLPLLIKRATIWQKNDYDEFMAAKMQEIKADKELYTAFRAECKKEVTERNFKSGKPTVGEDFDKEVDADATKLLTKAINKEHGFQIRHIPRVRDKTAGEMAADPKGKQVKLEDLVMIEQLCEDTIEIPENDRIKVPVTIIGRDGKKEVVEKEYRLTCSVKHGGHSIGGGHFTSHVIQHNTVKQGDQEVEEKSYFHCDDHKITGENREAAEMGKGYIFFFELVE